MDGIGAYDNGDGTFTKNTTDVTVTDMGWSYGNAFGDYDNDGFEDLYITNGYRRYVTDMDYKKFTFDSLKKTSKSVELLILWN